MLISRYKRLFRTLTILSAICWIAYYCLDCHSKINKSFMEAFIYEFEVLLFILFMGFALVGIISYIVEPFIVADNKSDKDNLSLK